MLRIQAMYFDSIRCCDSYASYCATINKGVFPGKMCSDRRKNHGWGQKNQKALALLGLASGPQSNAVNSTWTQALCRPSSQQNRQQRLSPRSQIRNLNFSPSTKKTTEYSLELFLSSNKIVFYLWLSLLERGSPCDFGPETRDTA